MIKLRNIFELIRLAWQSKSKNYLLIYSGRVDEFETFSEAKAKAIKLMQSGEQKIQIAIELTLIKQIVEIKK